jgi:predicted nucleic-acid-binding protein
MIGVDTNVLVRYIVGDDPKQSKLAITFLEKTCSKENPGFVNLIVLCELVWVLRGAYKVDFLRNQEDKQSKPLWFAVNPQFCKMSS